MGKWVQNMCNSLWFCLWLSQDTTLNVLATCCYSLQRVVELMASSGLVFTQIEANEAAQALKVHLKSFMWLASFYFQKRKMLFKLRCKTHYLFHVADEIQELLINPAMWENFEESWLGKFKRIGIRCHGGTCTSKVFMRYLLYLTTQLREFNKSADLWEWMLNQIVFQDHQKITFKNRNLISERSQVFGGLNRGRPPFEKQNLSEEKTTWKKFHSQHQVPKTRPSRLKDKGHITAIHRIVQ